MQEVSAFFFSFRFDDLEHYRENNRLEAKKAQGGLPRSIWETYSAFANTQGGAILLGVEERSDKTLHIVGVPDPEKLLADCWNTLNNPEKVSVNILSDADVRAEEAEGKRVIVIEVPRAQRNDKPVYINNNLLSGTYRRNGEGDYHCTKADVQAMLRDAVAKTQDMLVLESMDLSVFDYESVSRYRLRMKSHRPDHVWEGLKDDEFLYKLGAVGRGEDGQLHPTGAGLLMFGFEYEIVREYPQYFLDYQEQLDASMRWTDRIISSSGEWSGNIHDFYFRVYNRLSQAVKVPFQLDGIARVDDTPVHKALREVLANCLINADYYGPRGLVIIRKPGGIKVANPGGFRIDVREAINGGTSDPRNATLMKMFNLINIGERAGSGIPNIYAVWKNQGWSEPSIDEKFSPDRTFLSLPTGDNESESAIKASDKPEIGDKIGDNGEESAIKSERFRQMILEYLSEKESCKASDIAKLLDLGPSRTRDYLMQLVDQGILVAEGSNKNRTYRLKK